MFWKDTWVGSKLVKEQFPNLYRENSLLDTLIMSCSFLGHQNFSLLYFTPNLNFMLYMTLHEISHPTTVTMANVINQTPSNISYWRALAGNKLIAWHNQVAKISGHQHWNGRWLGYHSFRYTQYHQVDIQDPITRAQAQQVSLFPYTFGIFLNYMLPDDIVLPRNNEKDHEVIEERYGGGGGD